MASTELKLVALRPVSSQSELKPGELLVKTKDDKSYAIERELWKHSNLMRDVLGETEKGQEPEIPFTEVDSENLQLIVTYLEMYRNKPPRSPPFPMVSVADSFQLCPDIDQMDKDFINKLVAPGERDPRVNMDQCKSNVGRVKRLMSAANFLAITTLRDICVVALADYLRDPKPGSNPPHRTPEEILQMFESKLTKFTQEDLERGLQLLPRLREFLPKDKPAE